MYQIGIQVGSLVKWLDGWERPDGPGVPPKPHWSYVLAKQYASRDQATVEMARITTFTDESITLFESRKIDYANIDLS